MANVARGRRGRSTGGRRGPPGGGQDGSVDPALPPPGGGGVGGAGAVDAADPGRATPGPPSHRSRPPGRRSGPAEPVGRPLHRSRRRGIPHLPAGHRQPGARWGGLPSGPAESGLLQDAAAIAAVLRPREVRRARQPHDLRHRFAPGPGAVRPVDVRQRRPAPRFVCGGAGRAQLAAPVGLPGEHAAHRRRQHQVPSRLEPGIPRRPRQCGNHPDQPPGGHLRGPDRAGLRKGEHRGQPLRRHQPPALPVTHGLGPHRRLVSTHHRVHRCAHHRHRLGRRWAVDR